MHKNTTIHLMFGLKHLSNREDHSVILQYSKWSLLNPSLAGSLDVLRISLRWWELPGWGAKGAPRGIGRTQIGQLWYGDTPNSWNVVLPPWGTSELGITRHRGKRIHGYDMNLCHVMWLVACGSEILSVWLVLCSVRYQTWTGLKHVPDVPGTNPVVE